MVTCLSGAGSSGYGGDVCQGDSEESYGCYCCQKLPHDCVEKGIVLLLRNHG